jgi:hypothetical protein
MVPLAWVIHLDYIGAQLLIRVQTVTTNHSIATRERILQPNRFVEPTCRVELARNATIVHVEEWVLNDIIGVGALFVHQVQTSADQVFRLIRDIVVVLGLFGPDIGKASYFLVNLFLGFRLERRVSSQHRKAVFQLADSKES